MDLGRWSWLRAAVLFAVLAAGAGGWLLSAASGGGASRQHVAIGGVPMDEVHPPASGGRRPGVVVAHGFAGSARLMAPFADTLAARGYVVVLLDFSGHGTNVRPLPTLDGSNVALTYDLDVAVTYLRGLPDVDPTRIALVGHSMGAMAVTRYAATHPDIGATVAISLPDGSAAMPDRLRVLAGGLEFADFRAAARHAVAAGGDRSALIVPGVEHVSILYAPRTHRETVAWLDRILGAPNPGGSIPSPLRRPAGGGLLLMAFVVGFYPVARLALGPAPFRLVVDVGRAARLAAVAAGAAVVAMLVAPVAPTIDLPLALTGFIVGFTAVLGAALLAYHRVRGLAMPGVGPFGPRLAVAAPVLVGYAVAAIAVPLQLGLTEAEPRGVRWWVLACLWSGFALLGYGAERASAGNLLGGLAVSAVVLVGLTCAAALGLTSGFIVLIVPLLAILLLWQAAWGVVLRQLGAPAWLIALVGSVLVAWPLATALPVIN